MPKSTKEDKSLESAYRAMLKAIMESDQIEKPKWLTKKEKKNTRNKKGKTSI